MIIPLTDLVALVAKNKFALCGEWRIVCPLCERHFDFWPSRGNISCTECGEALVAIVDGTKYSVVAP